MKRHMTLGTRIALLASSLAGEGSEPRAMSRLHRGAMTARRKSLTGLCVLGALAISGLAAQGAIADTAFECAKGLGAKDFSDAHCKSKVESGKGEYGHVSIPVNTPKSITVSNETTGGAKTTTKLKSVQSGVTLELQSTELSSTGTLENKESGAEMWAESTGTITFKNVTVTSPAGKGCKVTGGQIVTNTLVATTKGLTNQIRYTPAAGTVFAEITIEACSIFALNRVYKSEGSVIGNREGATINLTHEGTTAQGTLKLSGQKAGIDGTGTTKAASGNGLTGT